MTIGAHVSVSFVRPSSYYVDPTKSFLDSEISDPGPGGLFGTTVGVGYSRMLFVL